MIAGAGAAYLNGGSHLGIGFHGHCSYCAFRGLAILHFIGVGWLCILADVLHHFMVILSFHSLQILVRMSICDPVIALWCFGGRTVRVRSVPQKTARRIQPMSRGIIQVGRPVLPYRPICKVRTVIIPETIKTPRRGPQTEVAGAGFEPATFGL